MKSFGQYQLPTWMIERLNEIKFFTPTPIQDAIIRQAKKGRDIVAIAPTGSGKTHSFLIPCFMMIDTSKEEVQVVITAPTRELASQIYDNAIKLAKGTDIHIMLATGGQDRQRVVEKLKVQPHVVIGTPGRLKDLYVTDHVLQLTTASVLVVDEADMTLDLGFLSDIDEFAGKMKDDIHMMVFSATMHQAIEPFILKYLYNPVVIDLSVKQLQSITHTLIPTHHRDRLEVLKQVLGGFAPYLCLIFANTRVRAHEAYLELKHAGFDVVEIHGDLKSRERKKVMRQIKDMHPKYVVATDMAARGIDIDGVSHVINIDFPKHDLSFFFHRAGRTGRYRYEGYCYSLYDAHDHETIQLLKSEGITFLHEEFKDGVWVTLKPYNERQDRPNKKTTVEPEVSRIVNQKRKVKPGYKKKRKQEVQKIMSQKRRAMIKDDIKKQKKKRAMEAQKRRGEMS